MSSEKWTKARCERALKDPTNWKVTSTGEFIQERQFEFHALRFVRYEVRAAIADWNHSSYDPSGVVLKGEWIYLGKTFVRTVLDGGGYALRDISRPNAVGLMLEAVKQEEHNPDE